MSQYLFVYVYFHDAFRTSDHIALKSRMLDECWVGKNMEASRLGLFQDSILHSHGGTEENHETK